MSERLLHVFRNTPLGRETLLQSMHFCNTLGVGIHIYIPEFKQFIMYFDHDMVQVDLDGSYLTDPGTAKAHALELAEKWSMSPTFYVPNNFTASQLPDIPTHFSYMCCPRSISDLSSKIGLGYIGPKVRRIIQSSTFPVFMAGGAYKEWKSIMVFYGGSINANKALRWGIHLSSDSGLPLDMFTYAKGKTESYFMDRINEAGLGDAQKKQVRNWHRLETSSFEESLYHVPHDALLIVGAYGHGLLKEFLLGSKMETVQSWMPNNMLLVGPNCVLGS